MTLAHARLLPLSVTIQPPLSFQRKVDSAR